MWWRFPHNPTAYDDDWEDQPAQGSLFKWGLGLLAPLLLAGYGVHAIATRQATFGGQVSTSLAGANAFAFGAAWLSAGLFLHCHYFWGNIYDQAWPAVLGKILSACGFIAGLGCVLIHNGIFGK
ncbi:MAG TPA: hypothetical protein VGI81_02660 [Tepidisphaeraceae bacterium]|jgi:hypothetical protein